MKDPNRAKAPDGGWGWMVCLGASVIAFSLRALEPSFGLVFHDFLIDLGSDSTETSVITSVFDANMNFSGLFVGPLLKRFSYRIVVIAGAILSSIGLITTSRAQSVTNVVCTYSVLAGIGNGLAMAGAFVAINNYFDKNRGQAVGLYMVGTAIAMMLMPQLAHVLLDAYGFRGTMLIIGGWSMHSLIGGCLLRPVKATRKRTESLSLKVRQTTTLPRAFLKKNVKLNVPRRNDTVKNAYKTLSLIGQVIENGKTEANVDVVEDVTKPMIAEELVNLAIKPKSEDHEEQTADVSKKKSVWSKVMFQWISNFLNLELLKDSVYLNVIVGLSLFNVAETNFKLMTPFFLRSVGMTKSEIAFCLSLTAFSDIMARLILPPIFDRMDLSKRRIFWISSLLVSFGRSIFAERSKGILLTVILVLNGFIRGAVILNINLSVSECCSLQKLPHALGLFMVTKGIFSLTLSPLIGFVRDYSGSYRVCIHAMSILIILAFISWSMEFWWKAIRRSGRKSEKVLWIDKPAA